MEKYGHEYPWQSPEIKEKIRETNIEKYGIGNPWSDSSLDNIILSSPDNIIKTPNGETNRFAEMRKIVLEVEPKDYIFNLEYSPTSELIYAKKLKIKDPTNYTTELKLSKI